MDNGNEMRDFLVSRRARITPEQAGLPAYGGNRRVAGLRREEVALLAGVSIDYYTRLERGRAHGASDSVLEGIARALHLDEAERAHLFDLARAAATAAPRAPRRPASQQVRPSVRRILDSMTTTPAYVRNARLDILAARVGVYIAAHRRAPLRDGPGRSAASWPPVGDRGGKARMRLPGSCPAWPHARLMRPLRKGVLPVPRTAGPPCGSRPVVA
jgi:transcriptional regulator with XRE-family HTH domain